MQTSIHMQKKKKPLSPLMRGKKGCILPLTKLLTNTLTCLSKRQPVYDHLCNLLSSFFFFFVFNPAIIPLIPVTVHSTSSALLSHPSLIQWIPWSESRPVFLLCHVLCMSLHGTHHFSFLYRIYVCLLVYISSHIPSIEVKLTGSMQYSAAIIL